MGARRIFSGVGKFISVGRISFGSCIFFLQKKSTTFLVVAVKTQQKWGTEEKLRKKIMHK